MADGSRQEVGHGEFRGWERRRLVGGRTAIHAIKRVARIRLTERCGLVEGQDFEVRGVPRDVEGAHDLWKRNPYHFRKWAVEQVDGFVTAKSTADGGIDGRLYFAHPDHKDLQGIVRLRRRVAE